MKTKVNKPKAQSSQEYINVGIVGYSATSFNEAKAEEVLNRVYSWLLDNYSEDYKIRIVSGLTNIGVPKIAYALAKKKDWETVGIACKEAENYELFPVTKKIIVGDAWGDESATFIKYIDMIIRIGGGKQSHTEINMFKKEKPFGIIIEYDI
jgi:hypothetical protein